MKKHRAIDRIVFNVLMRAQAKDEEPQTDGGPGSGNHHHAGRPGEAGGSAPAEGATKSEAAKPRAETRQDLIKAVAGERNQTPAIKKVDPAGYIPTEGSDRYTLNQGWNRERNEYLQECGFDKDDVNTLNWLIDNHIHYAGSADEEMAQFIKDHPDLIQAVGEYEAAAAKSRQKLKAAQLAEQFNYSQERAKNMKEMWPEEAPYIDEKMALEAKAYKRQMEELKQTPMLYRKGGYEDPVLSFTPNPNGVTLYAGTDYEEQLYPDHQGSLDDLMKQGIIPVSGFGAKNNFYGEEEVTFVNTNAGTPAKE